MAPAGQCLGNFAGLLAGGGDQRIEQGGFAHAALAQQDGALAGQVLAHRYQRVRILQGRDGQHRVAQLFIDAGTRLHLAEGAGQILLGDQHEHGNALGREAEQQAHQQGFVERRVAADQHGGLIDVGGDDLLAEGIAAHHAVAAGADALDGAFAVGRMTVHHVVADHAVHPAADRHGGDVFAAMVWCQQEVAAPGSHHVGFQPVGAGLATVRELGAGFRLAAEGAGASRTRSTPLTPAGQCHGLVLVAGTGIVVTSRDGFGRREGGACNERWPAAGIARLAGSGPGCSRPGGRGSRRRGTGGQGVGR